MQRREQPVGVTQVLDMETFELLDAVALYRFDDVDQMFRDNVTFSSSPIRELMSPIMGPYVMVGLDEPEHRRHRNLVSQAFRQKSLAHWETDYVEVAVHELVDRFGRGHAELVRELTFRYPVQVIAKILGIPPEEQAPEFHQHAIAIVNIANDPERGVAAAGAIREYLQGVVDTRAAGRTPQDDVISDLVTTEGAEQRVPRRRGDLLVPAPPAARRR